MMTLDATDVADAVARGILAQKQADALQSLMAPPSPRPRPRAIVVAEVLLAAALAMSLALGPLAAWLSYAGPGMAAAGGAYSALLLAIAVRLWRGPHTTAAGTLVAAAALMVPFTVHGLEHVIGFFPDTTAAPRDLGELLRVPAFNVDVAAVSALALAVWRFPFPPLAALLTGAAWLLAMDAAPLAFGDATTWSQRALLSTALGLCAAAVGVLLDSRTRRDFACWLYVAGLFAFCSGLTTFHTTCAATIVVHAAIDVSLIAVGLLLDRRVFAIFGALALAGAVGHLAAELLGGAVLIAVAFGIACAVVAGAAAYLQLERRLAPPLRTRLPPWLRRLLPPLSAA